jgi:hypothetical protein
MRAEALRQSGPSVARQVMRTVHATLGTVAVGYRADGAKFRFCPVRTTDQPLTRPGATTSQQRDALRRAVRGASAPGQATAPGRVQPRVGRPIGSATTRYRFCRGLRPRIRQRYRHCRLLRARFLARAVSWQNRRAEAAARECLPVSQNAFAGSCRAWARSECRPRAEAATDHACQVARSPR